MVGARDLLLELEGRGVRLLAEGGRLVARGPSGSITPELSARIRAHRDDLLRELTAGAGGALVPLPEPLARLVRAAAGDSLNRPGFLSSGMVPDLSVYVLTCAALYACGFDPARQLELLWQARAAWSE